MVYAGPAGFDEERLRSPEIAAYLSQLRAYRGLDRRPVLAVLDTSCIRTGLHYQLSRGTPPASVREAHDQSLRLFMEYETLKETGQKLPEFAQGLGVTVSELKRILNDDWLPYIDVVQLPEWLRGLDLRALAVKENDPDDYPAAALAALLSPCLLLTENYRDFGPLGITRPRQGVDGVVAAVSLDLGEMHFKGIVAAPGIPMVAIGGAVKWTFDRLGPVTWLLLAAVVAGGVVLYRRQPAERRDGIRRVAAQGGKFLLEQAGQAAETVSKAQSALRGCAVPAPESRHPTAVAFREMAMSFDSLSAQQLFERTENASHPVKVLRALLRAEGATFVQVCPGAFVLGRRGYQLRQSAEPDEAVLEHGQVLAEGQPVLAQQLVQAPGRHLDGDSGGLQLLLEGHAVGDEPGPERAHGISGAHLAAVDQPEGVGATHIAHDVGLGHPAPGCGHVVHLGSFHQWLEPRVRGGCDRYPGTGAGVATLQEFPA
jgi:hypothetical protein